MKVSKFEDLDCWQEARALTQSIYQLTANSKFSQDYGLRDQMRRASVSIMANIAEGFMRRSDKEFVQYLYTAMSSAAEVQSHLYVALDAHYVSEDQFKALYDQATKAGKLASGFITYLRSSETRRIKQTK